jgi:Putative zinc ribbon domain
MNKFCQSCGYPIKKDIKGGGSNADGSINKKYCSMCYEGGKFLSPPEVDTAQKFQTFCIREMKKNGMNVFFCLAGNSRDTET